MANSVATGFIEGLFKDFETLGPFQHALQLFFVQQVALAEEVLRRRPRRNSTMEESNIWLTKPLGERDSIGSKR